MGMDIKKLITNIPSLNVLRATNAWKMFRHRMVERYGERENSTFTGFLRLPAQFEALAGPVIEHVLAKRAGKDLKIGVIGCSNGSEAYTIASVIANRRPDVRFTVNAYDIDNEMIKKAREASYLHDEIYNNKIISESFVKDTFDADKGVYRVKDGIRNRVSFAVADALDAGLKSAAGGHDIVFAQNFIFHMKPDMARKAFNNICLIVNAGGAFFADGVDLDIRQELTRTNGLTPLEFKIEEIHKEARLARAIGWPYSYWGLEPFLSVKKDWKRRYSTIFLRS